MNSIVLITSGELAAAPIDRPWLAVSRTGAVYLSYVQLPTGLWVARSSDRGETFAPAVRAAPTEMGGAIGYAGAPAVEDGIVTIPYFTSASIESGPAAPSALRVAISDDEGKTFVRRDVMVAPPGRDASYYFPALAAGRECLTIAWAAPDGVRSSSSADQGMTWSRATTLSDGAPAASPAVAEGLRGVTSAWAIMEGEQARIVAARGGVEADVASAITGSANTDFVSLAVWDGLAFLAWTNGESVIIAREG